MAFSETLRTCHWSLLLYMTKMIKTIIKVTTVISNYGKPWWSYIFAKLLCVY